MTDTPEPSTPDSQVEADKPEGQKTTGTEKAGLRGLWGKRWVQNLTLSLLIGVLVLGYYVYRRGGLWFLNPSLPSIEAVMEDDTPVKQLAAAMDIPDPPDLATLERASAERFYIAFKNVRNFPGHGRYYGQLARLYEAHGLGEGALLLYQRAADMEEDSHVWHYHIGLLAHRLGETSLARSALEKAIELDPSYAPAYLRLGEVELAVENLDGAGQQFKTYVEKRPDDIHGPLALARLARMRGNWQAVVDHLNGPEGLADMGREGHELLAQAYENMGQTEEADRHRKLVQDAPPVMVLADQLQAEVVALRPSLEDLAQRYISVFQQRRFREALSVAQRIRDIALSDQELAQAWVQIAECHRLLGENNQALAAVARAKVLAPLEPEPYVTNGWVRLATMDLMFALTDAEKAIQLREDFMPAYFLRARTLQTLAQQPPEVLARSRIQQTRVELARQAVEDLRRVLVAEPTNQAAFLFLGYGLGMIGEYEKAAEMFEQGLALHPEHPMYTELLAAAKAHDPATFWPATQPATGPAETRPASGAPTRPVP